MCEEGYAVMPDKKTLDDLFGDNCKCFGVIEPGLQVVYALASQKFPIGNILDRNTPADLGRSVIDRTISFNQYGMIYHVSLAHDKHNIVVVDKNPMKTLDEMDGKYSITHACDGLIIPRRTNAVIETFLGDCACIVVWSHDWVGYMHVGRPEVMQGPTGVIEEFFRRWPGDLSETKVWFGPSITGNHYELPNIPEEFSKYRKETVWGTQGFRVNSAILGQIKEYGKIDNMRIQLIGIDPFELNENGDHTWAASDQWYRRKGKEIGISLFSPRNSAMLFVG